MNVAQYPSHGHAHAEARFVETSSERTGLTRAGTYLQLLACAIRAGQPTSFTIRGGCMWPTLRPGDRVSVRPLRREPRLGDVLICQRGTHLVAHRVVQHVRDAQGQSWIRCRGDAALALDAPLCAADVLGIVAAVERAGRTRELPASTPWCSRAVAPLRAAVAWLSAQARVRSLRNQSRLA